MTYILTNGFIFNSATHSFEDKSLLVSGDRIRCIGSLSECRMAASGSVVTLDLKQKLLLPAFTDAHTHFVEYAKQLILVELSACNSIAEIEQNLVHYRENLSWKPLWILGGSWDRNKLSEPQSLNCHFLDRIFPDLPVALLSKDYHSVLLNSLALKLVGIDKRTPDPSGGRIEKDKQGEPTGVLYETATNLVSEKVIQPSDGQIVQAIRDAVSDMYQYGLVGFHSMEYAHSRDLLLQAQENGSRFRFCWHFMLEDYETAKREYKHSYEGNEWFKPGGLKLFGDGSLGSQTAAMFEPYENGSTGILRHSAAEMLSLMQDAAEHGFSTTVHAIGNSCVAQVIDCALQIRELSNKQKLLQRIEHVQSIRRGDIQRLKESGLLASVQPVHLANDVPMIHKYWHAIEDQVYAFGSLQEAGVTLAFGSDAPIESLNPFLGIHAAVHRHHLHRGEVFRAEEALSPEQAIHAFSLGAAKASCSEKERGSLEVGKLADLIVINDYRREDKDFWLNARSLLTMLSGEIVHSELD